MLDRALLYLVRRDEIKAFHVVDKSGEHDLVYVSTKGDAMERFLERYPEAVMVEAGALACIIDWFEKNGGGEDVT
jgi:hypothetical protein